MTHMHCSYPHHFTLTASHTCDVLVIGSGLAGISASIAAAQQGAHVVLACKGPLFSGSSFFPGTWGLGLIGPTDTDDEQDLIDTITSVGCNMVVSDLVSTLAKGIRPAIEDLCARGVQLKEAHNANEKEFIPCFDHKQRLWHGLTADSMKQVFTQELHDLGVTVLSGYEALELCQTDASRPVHGAVFLGEGALHYIQSKAVILATGGYGGLFEHHLCTNDVQGTGQALALHAGARLVNMEFMQVMPGYVTPAYQTIFNEKTFRFTNITTANGEPLFTAAHDQKLLALRSTHGPFTSRLSSCALDLAINTAYTQDPRGVRVTYTDDVTTNPPEFVTTYFDWLKSARGLTPQDPVFIAPFAHAANGGILIDPQGFTGVPGLFAAGEGTGGMHGADRIGGLSTANGLVFGTRAGKAAATFAQEMPAADAPSIYTTEAATCSNYQELLSQLRHVMSQHLIIERTDTGLAQVLNTIATLGSSLKTTDAATPREVAATKRIEAQLTTAQAITRAARWRTESRGSHFRRDYPYSDESLSELYVIDSSMISEK